MGVSGHKALSLLHCQTHVYWIMPMIIQILNDTVIVNETMILSATNTVNL